MVQDEYSVRIKDIIEVCEYNKKSGTYYKQIKEDFLALRNSAIWIETERGEETMGWLVKARVENPKKKEVNEYQKVIFKFDEGLGTYLFDLQKFYTQYSLEDVLLLSHKYSLRLCEYLLSYANLMYVIVPIEELKIRIDAISYNRFDNFERRILKPAIEDINEHTKITVEYDKIRKGGNAYTHIAFYIWGINEDSIDYTINDMRIIAGTKANIERRKIKKEKQKIDKEKIIKANGEITAQTSMFSDD